MIICLCTTIARRLNRNLPECHDEASRFADRRPGPSILHPVWSSSGWGLPSHRSHLRCWCALTAPFQPYHAFATDEPFGGLLSAALFPSLAAGRRYRPSCSMEPGLSSSEPDESNPPAITPPTDGNHKMTDTAVRHKVPAKIQSGLKLNQRCKIGCPAQATYVKLTI